MALEYLNDGWVRFGAGRKWRCAGTRFLCEVDNDGNTPNYLQNAAVVSRMRRVQSFYAGRISFGTLDEHGTGLNILTANSFAESYGTVPSPLSTEQLRNVFANASGGEIGVKLDEVIHYVADHAPYLERREPHYVDPVATSGRVSIGAHHVLVSTALALNKKTALSSPEQKQQAIIDLVCRVPAESLLAAGLAVQYFNERYSLHFNQPPLLAATYNAGSPRPDAQNPWNLRQYGNHLDRWIAFYNTSRMI